MKTRSRSTKKLEVLGLILVCAFNLSSPHALASAFEDSSEKIIFIIDDGQRDIYMMDPDGGNVTSITNTPELSEVFPLLSPDRTKISFSCEGDIWVMNRDGSDRINLTQTPGFYEEPHSWSPGGSEIVYSRRVGMGIDRRIYVMNAAGTYHNELTSGHTDEHPCWSPDGARIVFDRYLTPGQPTSRSQIYVMKTDGTDVHRISYNGADDMSPAWSPDGTRILFSSTRGGNVYRMQIFVGDFSVRPDGVPQLLNQTNITNNIWRHGCPQWSPNGSQVVYHRAPYGTGDYDIWMSNADGSGLIQLTNTPGIRDTYPYWAIIPKPNQSPIANAGPDQTVFATEGGIAQVTLDGSGSSDPDGDELTCEWTWSIGGDAYNATGINPTIELPIGEHTIQLIVNDGTFDSEPDYVEITILNASLSGWVWMDGSSDIGYSLDEGDLLCFFSWEFVMSFNLDTGEWLSHIPVGWIYVDWPFYYELDTDASWFALPPEIGLWVYHFSTGQWEVLPQIIPW